MDDIKEKPLFVLEEQLTRQKSILNNSNLLRKLPDKGAKVRETVAKLEEELERRRKQSVEIKHPGSIPGLPDVAKLEWALRTTTGVSISASSVNQKENHNDLDSDDDDDAEIGDEASTLKLLAESQITQRQPKPVIACAPDGERKLVKLDVKPDPYLAKLVDKEAKKSSTEKFVPAKAAKKKEPGSVSPALSATSEGSASSSSKHKGKWDECLLPSQSNYDGVKLLSMEETIKISCEKYKEAEETKANAPPKKTSYAYDKLRDQGVLGTYSVALQVSRPIQPDVDDDGSDLSHDSITDDSDLEDDAAKSSPSSQKTSKDLSRILNSSLKLS